MRHRDKLLAITYRTQLALDVHCRSRPQELKLVPKIIQAGE